MSTLKVGTIQDHANSNNALLIDSSGRVTQPAKPFISLLRNADGDYTVGNTITDFRVEESRGITHSGGVMTVPVAGLYYIYICGIMNTTAGIHLQVQNTIIHRIIYSAINTSNSAWESVSGHHIMSLNANDEVKFTAANGTVGMYGASSNNTVGGAGIYLIG